MPQGSILGPLFFIIYINDIAKASQLFSFIIYADDTTLSTTLELVINSKPNVNLNNILNDELANVNDWFKLNKLSVNIAKCKYMVFHTAQKRIIPLQLFIDNTQIEKAHEFNFLGLTLNEHMNWKSHINNLSNKISRSIGILNKLKHFIPLKTKVLIYNSLILSYLNYAILAWGYQCERITKLQKKAIQIINLSKYNAHTEPLFKELTLLKVTDILKLQELKFYYKYKNNKLPHYLQSLPFSYNIDIHSHETRIQNRLHEPKTTHEFAKKCIRYDIVKVVNSTPAIILDKIQTHSLQGFAGYIKHTIFQSYQETCTIVNCYICNRH